MGISENYNTDNFPEQKDLTKEDVVIVCWDYGGRIDLKSTNDGYQIYSKLGFEGAGTRYRCMQLRL